MIHLDTPLKNISKITPKYAKVLEKMGLVTVQDFLLYFPFRYDDFSKTVELGQNYLGETITVEGTIIKAKNIRIFRRKMTITEIVIQDKNNTPLKTVWFNQPYILENLKEGESIRLSGKLAIDKKIFSMANPAWEKASRDATNTGRLVPVYSETAGISSKWIRWQIKPLLRFAKDIPDILPEETRKKFNLYDLRTAITQIHFPDSREKLVRAQKRMAFQEMFLVQLKSLQVKKQWEKNNSIDIKFDEKLIKEFVEKLPFKLTNAQRKASFEILKDLEKSKPMNRLLEGDVGSGKTVVAAISTLQSISAGYQVAIMAPTEVLARQHFESFCKLFENYGINIALLTNSYQEINNFQFSIFNFQSIFNDKILKNKKNSREYLLKSTADGKINLIVGTHALIQKDVRFKNLALIIIDEQHRFGVAQRATLQQETMSIKDPVKSPNGDHGASGEIKTISHLLTMTATPIPRTLAIAFFGSLGLSILDEMPKNRKPIVTKIVPPSARNQNYNFIRQEIGSGRQVFVIFPLIEESKALSEVKAAAEEYKKLQDIFPDFEIGLLHGRMKPKEKEETMQFFKEQKTKILVSTSVIEVGIDIPNATVMIIENAERFGLSQLHQFRGRVGRGEHQSYCFLFTESNTQKSIERLKALEKTNDGFEISKIDLELRGPGQFFGTIQSGLPDITMENLSNVKLIKFAREEATNLLKVDPRLKKHPLLADALLRFSEKIHLE
ncbi:MAG TPA: ATP-dependent DNA helicase RecG [Candidatus Moranbacteria bacterium]|nr:ATP-dependent DNA helicase RecG [Candidatus Moranbacteria bacterium]